MLINRKIRIIFFRIWVLIPILYSSVLLAQTKVKSTAIGHLPETIQDPYEQKIPQKSFYTRLNTFIVLTRKDDASYILESYTPDLKKTWQAPIVLSKGEEIEAFASTEKEALILTYQKAITGKQVISGYRVDLQSGQKKDPVKLMETAANNKRPGTALSPDASKIMVFQNGYTLDKLKSITATIYDANYTKIKDRVYDLQDIQGIASATVKITNTGDQLVALLINKGTKITVRRYSNTTTDIKGMDVQVGGAFEGKNIYVLDTKFVLQPDGNLYAATICADEKTGDYHSLKVVRFDFAASTMKYAPEFRFTPQYIAALNKSLASTSPIKRLEDIALNEIVVSPENQVIVIAEKKYNEGPKLPFTAKELHLFAYDEFLNPTWHSAVNKAQSAPVTEAFSGISYKAYIGADHLQIVTRETLNGKSDVFNRKINIRTGLSETPKPLGLNLAVNQPYNYLKDFTTWLDDKTIVGLAKSGKKPALQLHKITIK